MGNGIINNQTRDINRGGSRINFRVLPKFYKKLNIQMI